MKERIKRTYNLDNSAIMHMATLRKDHANSFRIVYTLKEAVRPEILQEAINNITPRFPTIIAGVKNGFFRHKVVPSEIPPTAKFEDECLKTMSRREVRECAVRFFYKENRIIAEFFHSMTDGYGGTVLMNTLLGEYFRIRYSMDIHTNDMILRCDEDAQEKEQQDDFFTYAGETSAPLRHHSVYQIPGTIITGHKIATDTTIYNADTILSAAHKHNVSVTTFLCGILMKAVMESHRRRTGESIQKPVQVMVPINLRKLFPSKTLRNFSLYALPHISESDNKKPFSEMLADIKNQMKKEFSRETIEKTITTHTKAEKNISLVPLWIKCMALRFINDKFGECNSCISLSNLGNISLSSELDEYVENMHLILTPRRKSPYNCGVVSFCGMMSITFSRICIENDLAEIFFEILQCNL
ncbi:MAG: hypothetical protein IKM61_04180 [Eubacteriaceae bacterium]|nr:hypothetical protein [Eubacteriaceae bacterium]